MSLHPSIGDGSLFAFAQILDRGVLVRHRSAQIIEKIRCGVNRLYVVAPYLFSLTSVQIELIVFRRSKYRQARAKYLLRRLSS
jgi:hypothetical protein